MLNGQSFRADRLGPIIEFENLASVEDRSALPETGWFDGNPHRPYFDARSGATAHWLQSDGRCGFIGGDGLACDQTLNSFKIDAHKAALAGNFGKAAPLLVASLGELIGNIEDHSEAVGTGLAVFSLHNRSFEFVVADQGIGALNSLRKCSEHSDLGDHGAALGAMIETGVSRFGAGTGHGNGFRPIFEKLADMRGLLRFRSGGYALTLDGRFGNRINLQVSLKPCLSGFFASVLCHLQ